MRFCNIGFGNMVAVDRVVSIASSDSAPMKRLIQDAKDDGRAIDVTCGKKTKTVIITDSNLILLSPLMPETVTARMEGGEERGESEDV